MHKIIIIFPALALPHTYSHTFSQTEAHFTLPIGLASFLLFFIIAAFRAEWIYFYPVEDHGAGVEGYRRDHPKKDRGELVPFGGIAAVVWFLGGSHTDR